MLRTEINELLTQTGPGTPMGQLFRRYWQPVLLAEELPGDDCPPVRVKVLSERLLAFRDSAGRYGLIDEFCAHRGGHDRLARLADNYTLVAQGADIDHFRHCDLLDSIMA